MGKQKTSMFPIFLLIFAIIILILIFGPKFSKGGCKACMSNESFSNTVPSKVVLQSFDQYFVTTKNWDNLSAETPDLSEYFTAYLIPPISASADAVGYIPTELFNFNSSWGSEASLNNLINTSNKYNVDLIADIVTQHRVGGDKKPSLTYNKTTDQHIEGSGKWFRYKNPSFLNEENVPQNLYYKYIDKVTYNPWGLDESDAPKNAFIDGLPPDFAVNGLQNCYIKKDGQWSLYKDCRNKVPMYNTPGKANPSWLQSVNLCNIDVLKTYIRYIKLLKSMGIKGIRFDQADAVSYQFISLFLNSDINKTPFLLQQILQICNEAKNPKLEKVCLACDLNSPLISAIENKTAIAISKTTIKTKLSQIPPGIQFKKVSLNLS